MESNRNLIELIQSAAFIVCLDEVDEDSSESPIEEMLHGGRKNAANRWYDCTLQFIINNKGDFGLCYDHSVCEGIPVVAMAHEIRKQLLANPTKEKYFFGVTPIEQFKFQQNPNLIQNTLSQENAFRTEQNRLGTALLDIDHLRQGRV